MDWKQILSQTPVDWTDIRKDEIYEQLITLKRDKIDKKNLKKFFDLAQHILKYKGEMVTALLTDLEQLSSKDRFSTENMALTEEIAELRNIVELADLDKAKYKSRIKELTEENSFLQRKQNEASNFGSGEDSPDVLSEIDRQEELLKNISAKNKHIKRLLRDIEALEQQTVAQSQQITELRTNLHEATSNLTLATNHLGELKQQLVDQSQVVYGANVKNTELQQQLATLNAANYDREVEIQKFGRDIEERALAWKQIVEEKDERLESLRLKYDDILDKVPGYDIDAERTQLGQMAEAVNERDTVITDLEAKLIDLSRELMTSTDMMNKLAREREIIYDNSSQKMATKASTCCQDTKTLLEQSANRCKELQDIVANVEEDNRHKAKQAMEAIAALSAYQAGEDGLAEQMKRNVALQNSIQSRDKQIRALVTEVNGLQEVAHENCVLRKQLGVPDDEVVSTKSYAARQRKIEKITEKLTLKLRASEEMRLQLKLEKNDLRRRIHELTVNGSNGETARTTENDMEDASPMTGKSVEYHAESEIKFCENCLKQYNADRPCHVCVSRKSENICNGCAIQLNLPEVPRNTGNRLKIEMNELESRYEIIVEENENLRIGMHEILKKLRDYDAESENIIIDSTMLQQVLHALDARSISGWYHPAMRLQNELIASKERENALKERIRTQLTTTTKMDAQPNAEEATDPPMETILPKTTLHSENFYEFYAEYISSSASEIAELRSAIDETTAQSRSFELKCFEIDILRTQIVELTDTLQSSKDEQELLLAKQYEEIIRCRTDLLVERKKTKFLHDDCHRMRKQSKADKEMANRIQFEMQKELIQNGKLIAKLNQDRHLTNKQPKQTLDHGTDNELIRLKVQLGKCTELFVRHLPSIDVQNVLRLPINELEQYAVVDGKLAVELLAKDEYLGLKERCASLEKHNQDLTIRSQHLNDLLAVHRQQIRSQQQFLAKSSEDEISLRHLVVDMQSESNEKYIIAKSTRELEELKCAHSSVLKENEELQQKVELLNTQIETIKLDHTVQMKNLDKTKDNTELKLRFLAKSHLELRLKYAPFMPLYPIVNFVTDCARILELSAMAEKSDAETSMALYQKKIDNVINAYADRENNSQENIEDRIKLLKLQSQCDCLESQLQQANQQIGSLQVDIRQHRLEASNWLQHWQTIEMLFADVKTDSEDLQPKVHRETQTKIDTADKCINTDNIVEDSTQTSPQTFDLAPAQHLMPVNPSIQPTVDINTHKSMESQLKQAMILASTRSSLLLETENRLAIAQSRIKALERAVEDRETQLKEEREQSAKLTSPRKDDSVLSATITSLQHLLQEKDTTLGRYQELLRDERSDRTKLYEDHRQEIRTLQTKIDDIEIKSKTKDRQIEQLREKLRVHDAASGATAAAAVTIIGPSSEPVKANTSDYLQLSDKHIEEMFLSERSSVFDLDPDIETTDLRKKVKDRDDEIRKLQQKLRDVSNREKMWEKTLSDKDREIESLNEKLTNSHMEFKDISENISTRREIEQLREMLEEKDRHINDLTDTLTHFHDDQQRFITDTSLHSAEQVSQLSSELSRSEATNRILNTQLEALKRQIANVCQREKQARDLVKTLKTQLIKRPVISVKTERSVSSREDHLQKRVHQLENEILITKEELRKQTNLVQSRRTKDAADLGLWDKQKRFQQLSESLKSKLVERENELEKVRSHFNTAKTTIARLEREKNVLENRLRTSGGTRYCSSPSCPNLHGASGGTKYTTAESPESYLTTHSDYGGGDGSTSIMHELQGSMASKRLNVSEANREIIDVLKARIQSQQRKIVAFELEGKGGNALTVEVEKLQEKLSHTEAQNLRLEAKNLQLQLDSDILRQGDKDERNRRQIKHLEDYITALKNELTQALNAKDSSTSLSEGTHTASRMGHSGQMEQTILSLRNVIERLKVENKNLQDGKKVSATKSNISKEMYEKLRNEFEKLQQLYSESLDKMSALQIELEIQNITCANCKARIEKRDQIGIGNASADLFKELQSIKEKLIQKSQLLEKAKILLTRAAAKERNFREQIVYWKRRCSELQNVPVIDEASE